MGGTVQEFGQTFVAADSNVLGIRLYINDPTRPGNPVVNELVGPADLALYDATNLLNPTQLAREQVLAPGDVSTGLWTFTIGAAVATTPGARYCFVIGAPDGFGLGLRGTSSTYAGGGEAFRYLDDGHIHVVERDCSFQVLAYRDDAVPEPAALALLGFGGVALSRQRRR